jgi:hypothetical protein
MNYQQFTLWDVFANIIPGIVVMFATASLLSGKYVTILQESVKSGGVFVAFIMVVFAFVIGWVFQSLARVIDNNIPWTKNSKDIFDDEIDKIPSDDETNYVERYMRGAKLFFADDDVDELDDLDWEPNKSLLFHLTYGHVYDNNIGRSHRFFVLMILSRSLYVAFILTAIAHLVIQLGDHFLLYSPALSPEESTVIIGVTVLSSYLMFSTRKYMERSRVKTMIGDFYRSELAD